MQPLVRNGLVSIGIFGSSVYVFNKLFKIEASNDNEMTIMDQNWDERSTMHIYNEVAKYFDKATNSDEFLMGMNILRRVLISNAHGKTLEIGTGTCKNLKYYKLRKLESLYLTDYSINMLDEAKIKVEKHFTSWKYWLNPIPIQLEQVDATKLPYPDNYFDTLVSTFTLCSFDDPQVALKEFKRVLKENGTLLLLEHGLSCKDTPKPNTLKYDYINRFLNKKANIHYSNWGCKWNRDIGDIVLSTFPNAFRHFYRFHFGTTLYVNTINARQ